MAWKDSAVTKTGVDLLNESLAGKVLRLTGAVGGTGTMTAAELETATNVVSKKQDLTILGIENIVGGKKVVIQITNKGVTEKYDLTQVAVFAALNNQETPSLLFILQDDRGIEVPAEADVPDFGFEMYAIFAVSNKADIQLTVESSTAVSAWYVKETIKDALLAHKQDTTAHELILRLAVGAAQQEDVYTKPETEALVKTSVDQHDADHTAHPSILTSLAAHDSRLMTLELKNETGVTGCSFEVTFEDLDGVFTLGAWNQPYARIEF